MTLDSAVSPVLGYVSVNSAHTNNRSVDEAASNEIDDGPGENSDEDGIGISARSTTPISISVSNHSGRSNSFLNNINNIKSNGRRVDDVRQLSMVSSATTTQQKTKSDLVTRRRRHRRDSPASVTTPSNCLHECGINVNVVQGVQSAHHRHRQQDYQRDGPSTPPGHIESPIEIVELDANRQTDAQPRHLLGAVVALTTNHSANIDNGTLANDNNVLSVDNDRIIVIADETLDVSTDEENVAHGDIYVNDEPPKLLALRPIIRVPYGDNADDDDLAAEVSIVYTEQHAEVKLNCEVDLDIAAVVWMRNGQVWFDCISHIYEWFSELHLILLLFLQLVHTVERNSQPGYRFVRDTRGTLVITNAMLEDDGKWQCEAENSKGYIESGRLLQLIVLGKSQYFMQLSVTLSTLQLFYA